MGRWFLKRFFKFFSSFGILFAVTLLVLFIEFHHFLYKPLTVSDQGTVFVIPPGMPLQKIAKQLSAVGVIDSHTFFLFWVWWQDDWRNLKAGEYLIKPGTTVPSLIEQFREGRVIQHVLTIVPGWNFQQLLEEMHKAPKLDHALQGLTVEEIMAKLGYPGESPEGCFFPETYYFPAGTTDIAFLKRAYRLLQAKLQTLWDQKSESLPLKSAYEALILASIIEKESSEESEYADIAGVYVRRLQKNMPLQADPTVVYGMGKEYKGQLDRAMLKTKNPYNTYQKRGLPPTPIAFPSEKAMIAAVHPKPGDTLYFVAKKDGKGHVFSKTLPEHNAAVAEYRKPLKNPGKQ